MTSATLSVEGLGTAGEGFATHEGHRVWLRDVAPGDEVEARLELKGKVWTGHVERVVTPSVFRRDAPCPLAGRCGGCDWLHLSDDFQGAAKEKRVFDALARGGVELGAVERRPRLPPSRTLAYRRRAALHVGEEGLFYFEKGTHRPVPIQACPALVPALAAKLAPLAALTQKHHPVLSQVFLAAEGTACSAALVFSQGGEEVRRRLGRAVLDLGFQGVVLQSEHGGTTHPILLGTVELRGTAAGTSGLPLYYRPDAFAQTHAEENVAMVVTAIDLLQLQRTHRVLELFGGNGNFTLALAERCAEVWMLEGSPIASQLARRAADEGELKNLRLLLGEAAAIVPGLVIDKQRFDAVLADPPRTGVRELGDWAAGLGAPRVVYVACDPESLARDARRIVGAGFRPEAIQIFDPFPQTHHVEAVMSFRR